MIDIPIQTQLPVLVCFHVQQLPRLVVKRFVFRLGSFTVHLCPECAELLAKGLLVQLQEDRQHA